MILSKTTIQMSKYIRDDQKQEWYDNEPIYICSSNYNIGDEIRDECKRRNISHRYYPNVIEYERGRGLADEKCIYVCKIQMHETGLKVRQLSDWAITKFNEETMYLGPYDIEAYSVWIQPQREVSISSGGYDDDGCPRVYAEHWRV